MREIIAYLFLALVLALGATSPAVAQTIPSSTFAALPGSATGGTLRWVVDGACTPIPGTPEIGGGVNMDLVSYDATESRWEFVSRAPLGTTESELPTFLTGSRIAYDPTASGAAADDVQEALDALFAGAGGGGGGGGGGGSTNLGQSSTASTVTITSDTGADTVIPAATATTAGVMAAADRRKLDDAFDQTILLDDPVTACATYTGAMKSYADGTAPDGSYRVRVIYKLTGSNALIPQTHFWKDSAGQWPYRGCFLLHPQLGGAFIGNFPDSLGRVTPNAAAVYWDAGIHLTVQHEGAIDIDETGLAEDSVLFEIGNQYMAGCVDAVGSDGQCDSGSWFGMIAGGVTFRGSVDVRIKTKNDAGWTGQGTLSMSPTEKFSAEVENDVVLLSANGANYANLSDFTLRYQNTDHSDVAFHSVASWGLNPPRLDGVIGNDGYGAILYGPQNWSSPSRLWNLKNLDYGILLGDHTNGGKVVNFSGCDAGSGVTNGTCGGYPSSTTGVSVDSAMLEGASYSALVISDLGYNNDFQNLYLETDPATRHNVALGPYFCDGVSGSAPILPKGTVVKEIGDCAAANSGTGAIAFDSNQSARMEIGAKEWGLGQVGGSSVLIGPGCEASDSVRIGGPAPMQSNVSGHVGPFEELTIASAIASSGGCKVVADVPALSPPWTAYYGRVDRYLLETKNAAFVPDLAVALGAPNSGGLVHWTQLVGMPAGFSDGSDDGSAGGATDLNGLTDVTLTTPAVGATLVWNGTQWVNGPLDLADADARTGVLGDANVSDAITASNYMPTAGGSFTGPVSLLFGASLTVGNGSSIFPLAGGVVQSNQFAASGSTSSAVDLPTAEVSGILGAGNGGLGISNPTSGGILLGTGPLAVHTTPVLAAGQLLIGDGTTDPTIAAMSGDATMTSGGVVSLSTGSVAANEIVSTGVSAGTYQAPTLTIDGDGRVTAASQGTNLLIGSGTKALSTTTILSGGCNTDTITAAGVLSTDVVAWSPNGDLSAVNGFRPVSPDGLAIYPPVPSSGSITVKTCNPTGASITPGAVTINWRVTR